MCEGGKVAPRGATRSGREADDLLATDPTQSEPLATESLGLSTRESEQLAMGSLG